MFDAHRIDLTGIPMAMSRLREACEAAKKTLSIENETVIQLPFLANDQHGAPINYEKPITRAIVEQLTQDLIDRLEAPCIRALTDAGLTEVEDVLLVGGMTRWPAVQATVERIFKKKPSKGANPDEVVALGAAAYAGILAGDTDDAALLDVTPHDLGIKVGDSGFSVVIARNSMLPVRARKLFATTTPDQKFVSIDVYQGESGELGKNRKLGQVVLDDLTARSRGLDPRRARDDRRCRIAAQRHRARAQDRPRGQRDDPALGRAVAARGRRDHQSPAPGEFRGRQAARW